MDQCPFCQILVKDHKHQIIARGKNFTAIRKLYKSNNVNFLIISNKHVPNLKSGGESVDLNELVKFINSISKGKDWNMKISNGKNAGQEVFHLHAHISSFEKAESWGI